VGILKNILIQPKSLILIFIVTALAAVSTAFIELKQSKREMLELMNEEGHSILETVLASSQNALISYNKIENEIKNRLLNNAGMIRLLNEKGLITDKLLEKIASENKIFRINIFNSSGQRLFASHKEIHNFTAEKANPSRFLFPIFNGKKDTLIIGIKPARFLDEQRFAVALATKDRKAIVININADELLKFRKEVGFGVLLKKVTENPKILYASLQDEKGIIAGSGNLKYLDSIKIDPFVQGSLKENVYKWRVLKKNSLEAFEVIHPFRYEGNTIGIFRLGLSLDPLNKINERVTRRIIIISIILFVFGFITITLIFLRQNFGILSKRFKAIESYSAKIVDNVSDGIVVMNSLKQITLMNKAAQSIINIKNIVKEKPEFESVFPSSACNKLWALGTGLQEIQCEINGQQKTFLFSLSEFYDENKFLNYILVFRDLTEQKQLEHQALRNEKMIAMGELASTVAHEIRNPLNSIGTIAQQIGKDYDVKQNETEFRDLTSLVYSEVKRINNIVESFLKFAKPQVMQFEKMSLRDFFDEFSQQYSPILEAKKISLYVKLLFEGNVRLDKSQMKQVFINLIDNSIDASGETNEITIRVSSEDNILKIIFSDKGKGIAEDKLDKIFDLYFTSKKKGNGIGLSVVHKIITAHGGTISVGSRLDEGTQFTIKIPLHS
jgi:two-component system, NtrC family, sensor histidine kinase HydH